MSFLDRLYETTTNEPIIATLEIACASWPSIFLCMDYTNHTFTTEDSRTVEFVGCPMRVALPARDNTGNQPLNFALDNIRGEAQKLVRSALANGDAVTITFRIYAPSQPDEPLEAPYVYEVEEARSNSQTIEITAKMFDIIDMMWPRVVYNSRNAPNLRFLQ